MSVKPMPDLMVRVLDKMEEHEAECIQDAQRARGQGYSFHADELISIANLSKNKRKYYKELWEIENSDDKYLQTYKDNIC